MLAQYKAGPGEVLSPLDNQPVDLGNADAAVKFQADAQRQRLAPQFEQQQNILDQQQGFIDFQNRTKAAEAERVRKLLYTHQDNLGKLQADSRENTAADNRASAERIAAGRNAVARYAADKRADSADKRAYAAVGKPTKPLVIPPAQEKNHSLATQIAQTTDRYLKLLEIPADPANPKGPKVKDVLLNNGENFISRAAKLVDATGKNAGLSIGLYDPSGPVAQALALKGFLTAKETVEFFGRTITGPEVNLKKDFIPDAGFGENATKALEKVKNIQKQTKLYLDRFEKDPDPRKIEYFKEVRGITGDPTSPKIVNKDGQNVVE